jgi:hypothetical protein
MERRFERQRLGLEPAPIADGLRTVDDLLDWWIENFLRNAPSYASTIATIRKHLWGLPPTLVAHLPSPPNRQSFPGFLTERDTGFEPATFSLGRAVPDGAVSGEGRRWLQTFTSCQAVRSRKRRPWGRFARGLLPGCYRGMG